MKISVIIPVYNKIRYLSTVLQQVKDQSFRDYECLLIDDGSTDGSGAVCDDFAQTDGRFRVFHVPNGGVSRARNIGLDAARGEYITFIDADDGIQTDYFENLVCHAETSKADLVISGYAKTASDGTILQCIVPDKTGVATFLELLPNFARVQLETGLYGCCAAKIFPRRLVKDIRFRENIKLAEDFDFYLQIYETVETVYLDGNAGYFYLQDAENSTGRTESERIDYLSQLQILLRYRSVLRRRDAFTGDNRDILEGRLTDYVFFVLFHTPISRYKICFEELYAICKKEPISLVGAKPLRKWLFFCLRHHCCNAARYTMCLYRTVRRIRNRK